MYTVYLYIATGRWFSPGTLVSSTNKTDRHDITEILLKVVLNTIKQTNKHICVSERFIQIKKGLKMQKV